MCVADLCLKEGRLIAVLPGRARVAGPITSIMKPCLHFLDNMSPVCCILKTLQAKIPLVMPWHLHCLQI